MTGQVYIGTSGWNYKAWKDDFYAGVPQKGWLHFYAQQFSAIEVNATFYRLQEKRTFERWRDETPAHFRFAIKGNRFLTHNKKLADPVPSIRLDRGRAKGLGSKLAAVLWQLPHQLRKNIDRLRAFAVALGRWPDARHVLEFRHVSWFDDQVADCLRAHRLAVCISDAADWPMWDAVTTDLVYIRLHGHTRTYASAYSSAALKRWAGRIHRWLAEGRDVHVYFDNDAEGAAPHDARRLIEFVNQGATTQS
ncbi:MAG: DUF72 domain-containing protein [Acidiferrobacterales bacterium]